MLKTYKDFLLELDLDMGGMGGEEKKEPPPDPEKEIAKAKAKKRKAANEKRTKELDAAEATIQKGFEETDAAFITAFKKRILDALDDDDRVIYHNLIIDLQRYEMPLAADQDKDEISGISPIIKSLQSLNANEYRG